MSLIKIGINTHKNYLRKNKIRTEHDDFEFKTSYDMEDDLINHIRFKEALNHLNNMSYEKRISFTEVSNREQILEQRGSIDTLAVYVRYRQNATWQGSVYHMKNNEREDFNSELDLLKIIENCQNSTKNVAESG